MAAEVATVAGQATVTDTIVELEVEEESLACLAEDTQDTEVVLVVELERIVVG